MAGIVEREGGLRSVNPLISLGGFWKHAGSLGVNDWIPVDSDQQVYYLHSKMRAMPHKRNEELVDQMDKTVINGQYGNKVWFVRVP